jgi:hypothetical protein
MGKDLISVTVRISYRGTIAEHTDTTTSGNPRFAAKEAEAPLSEAGKCAMAMLAAAHGDIRTGS